MSAKSKLSKFVLEMKFMKKTKIKIEKEDADAEGRAMYSSQITERMIHGSNYIIEPSFARCEELVEGRLSFKGMNPEIEALMELEDAEKRAQLTPVQEMKKEVSDQDMTDYYSNVARTISSKFNKFKKRKQENAVSKNKKFKKPKSEY